MTENGAGLLDVRILPGLWEGGTYGNPKNTIRRREPPRRRMSKQGYGDTQPGSNGVGESVVNVVSSGKL